MTAIPWPQQGILRPDRKILRPSVRDLVLRFMAAFQAPFVPVVATAGAGGPPASYTDAFPYANGPLPAPWLYDAGIWTVAANKAVGTPVPGGDLITNGNFAAWTAGDPNSWTVTEALPTAEVSQVGAGESHGGVGVGMCNVYRAGGGAFPAIAQTIMTIGAWYKIALTVNKRTSGYFVGSNVKPEPTFTPAGAYTATGRAVATSLLFAGAGDPSDNTIDDVSAMPLTTMHLMASVLLSVSDVTCTVDVTSADNCQAGCVVNLDDPVTPKCFILAYVYRPNNIARLVTCINGVYTQIGSGAIAYAAGRTLEIRKPSSNQYSLWYNGAQVGATQTVTDALLNSNKYHGMFSTSGGNQLDNFSAA